MMPVSHQPAWSPFQSSGLSSFVVDSLCSYLSSDEFRYAPEDSDALDDCPCCSLSVASEESAVSNEESGTLPARGVTRSSVSYERASSYELVVLASSPPPSQLEARPSPAQPP
jgi:hypothetical protein